jgi:type VI protein secretion system component VasK
MKRFEVPGWFLIVLMTAALCVAIWAVWRDQIVDLLPW